MTIDKELNQAIIYHKKMASIYKRNHNDSEGNAELKLVEWLEELKRLRAQNPCEDAVSRVDVLECFSDLYDTFEDCSKGIVNELHRKFEDLRTLPSVTPKYSDYKTDHGFMWLCPDCGLMVHSDFDECVRCGHKRSKS